MRKLTKILTAISFFTCSITFALAAQRAYDTDRERWLAIAEDAKPVLRKTVVRPSRIVTPVNDSAAFQHWRYDSIGLPYELLYRKNFKDIKEITLDFGKHITGYFSFLPATLTRCQDAPVRLRFFFGELPAELNTPLDSWKGSLSRAWMQDEIVTVTEMDSIITIPRRLAGRYMKVELLGASPDFDFSIDDMYVTATTSAPEFTPACPDGMSPLMQRINNVALATLSECMQTVYEDGPKRDHRLWSGDLYLESLANACSFRNFDLTKRCLYLFAGLADDNGLIISNVFESPEPHPQYGSVCTSYSLLWNSTLLEYISDTNDMETALDLWPVARRQVEEALTFVSDDGLYNRTLRPDSYSWTFFDWRDGLDTSTPMQGAIIFALDQTHSLAMKLGREEEVAHWPHIAAKMKSAALKHLYDRDREVFVSGPDRQASVLSQTWMIKSGVITDHRARKAIENILNAPDAVFPGTPYGTHYLIDAMIIAGMDTEAREYLTEYWGGMVNKGADTFWESYDPNDDFISAYGFSPLNSSCHAWSCTPVYFIAKYPSIFASSFSN